MINLRNFCFRKNYTVSFAWALGVLVLATFSSLRAQSSSIPEVEIGSTVGCGAGSTVQVPITMRNFPSIGAISLAIQYDPSSLSFLGSNGAALTSDSLFVSAYSPSEIRIAWAATQTPGSLLNDVLVNLNFQVHAPATLSFNATQTEIVDYNFVVLDSTIYLGGSLGIVQLPSFTGGLTGNLIVPVNGSTSIGAVVSGAASLRWQSSSDAGNSWIDLQDAGNYSGVFTSQLSLTNISASMNGMLFRVVASSGGNCSSNSAPALLTVILSPPLCSIGNATACISDTITIPVTLQDAYGLAAITLRFGYDAVQLEYLGVTNVNSAIAGGVIIDVPQPGGNLLLSWNDLNPVNINGLLFNVRFRVTGAANAPLTWDLSFNELADSTATIMGNVIYNNGSVVSHAPSSFALNASVCAPATYSFFGQNLAAAGVYTHVLTNYLGCDSVITLNLTVNQPTSSSISQSICAPNTYSFNGQNYGASGTYTAVLTNAVGCDSVVTLNLTVNALPVVGAVNGNTNPYVGGTVVLTAGVQGAVSQQWQVSVDAGATWSDITNGGNYSGSTTNQLTIAGIVSSLDNNQYRLIVTGAGGCQSISSVASLNVLIPNVGITSGSGCLGDTIQVNVSITDAPNLGAISMALNYNASAVEFLGFNNVNSQIASNVIINAPAPGGVVIVSWYNLIPASINGSLVNFRFRMLTGAGSDLTWDQSIVELADIEGNVVGALTYTNGAVVGLPTPAFVGNGVYGNTSVGVGGTVRLAALVSSTSNLQWQISTGTNTWSNLANDATYSGVTTNELVISNVQNSLNGSTYRVLANETAGCSVGSGSATITVLSEPLTVGLSVGSTMTCTGGSVSIPVNISNAFAVTSGSVKLLYNSTALTYSGHSGVLSTLSSSGFTVSASGDTLTMSWTSTLPLNLNGVLAQPQFAVNSPSLLGWNVSGSQLNGPLGAPLTGVSYGNGNIGVQAVSFGSFSGNTSLFLGQNASFTIPTTGFASLRWQSSTNGTTWTDLNFSSTYGGVITQTLTISNAALSLNNTQYRLSAVSPLGCVNYSAPVTLSVTLAPGGPQVFAGNVSGCIGDTISVPLGIMNGPDISAISLVLNYNNQMFQFVGVDQTIPQFGSTFIVNEPAPGGTVYFAWYDVNPIVSNGALMNARFVALSSGSSALSWNTSQSELASSSGDVILNTTFSDGSVSGGNAPALSAITGNLSVSLFGSTTLTSNVTGATGLQWQVSGNGSSWTNVVDGANYSGSTTNQLSISNAQLGMNGLIFRLSALNALGCIRYSTSVTLTINTPDPIVLLTNSVGCTTDTITIPVTIQNGYNLGAITLGLTYNAAQFEY